MKLDIIHNIVHQVYLDQEMQLGLKLSREVLPKDLEIENLLIHLNEIYNNKPAKSAAYFIQEEQLEENDQSGDRVLFHQVLESWLAEEIDFLEFSQSLARLFRDANLEAGVAEHGFLMFSEFQLTANRILMVSYLPVREGVMVQPDLSVQRAKQLDLSKMQLAARINLTEYQASPESFDYLTFIRGRTGSKAINSFMSFLNCEEKNNPKQSTETLIHAIQGVVADADLLPEDAGEVRQLAYDYCEEQWRKGEQVLVEDLEKQLTDKGTSSLKNYLEEKQVELPESFAADKSSLRRLIRFQGQGQGVSVGFDQNILGERIHYDAATDTLTIHGTPPNLRDQLRRFYGLND